MSAETKTKRTNHGKEIHRSTTVQVFILHFEYQKLWRAKSENGSKKNNNNAFEDSKYDKNQRKHTDKNKESEGKTYIKAIKITQECVCLDLESVTQDNEKKGKNWNRPNE